MTLIKSISGIRGTIGGRTGDTLNPLDIVKFTSAYATFIRRSAKSSANKIVVGRDARISGPMVRSVVCGTLMGMGYDVIDIGLATTPTTELAVRMSGADGGIIITASHNPRHWNALKLLNNEGEFLTKADGNAVLDIAEKEDFEYADVDHLGNYTHDDSFNQRHIDSVLALDLVDVDAIKKAHFKVCVDSINSVGGIILPHLLDALGVEYKFLNGEANGDFAHNPEPLERNLGDIMGEVAGGGYDLGIVVDPDVDRLAFIQEDGKMYGEEYTLVTVADYILDHVKGPTVSNLSSTRALRDVTERHGCKYYAAAGRDALVGIGLFLSSMAQKGLKASQLRATFPNYFMAKNRVDLQPDTDIDAILNKVKAHFASQPDVQVTDIDGVKLDFPDKWVHLRKSNTEPIIRVYSEAHTAEEADALGKELMAFVAK